LFELLLLALVWDSCKLCAGALPEVMNGNNLKIAFVCLLGIIAIVENGTLDQMSQRHAQTVAAAVAQKQQQEARQLQEQQRAQEQRAETAEAEQAAELAAQRAAAEHAQYLARYTDTGFIREPDSKTIAVVAASENGALNNAVGAALARRFKNERVRLDLSFFKPAFVSDGLFNDAFAGSNDLFAKLELSKSLDGLFLAREKVQYASNPSLDNVLTATMELDVETLPIGSPGQGQSWTFTAAGAGFSKADARAQAEERIIKQILTDTNMTLN
jgi:hypothetical protein